MKTESTDISQIRCPHCHETFDLNEGVLEHLKDSLAEDYREKERAFRAELRQKDEALQTELAKVKAREAGLSETIDKQVAERLKQLEGKARQEAAEALTVEMRDLQEQLQSKSQKLAAAEENELQLRRAQRELEEQRKTQELELARKLDAERKAIEEAASRRALEEHQFKFAEKDKHIGDLQKTIAELKRQSEQGSVQAQGEVLELGLEEKLRDIFRDDLIEPVAKGQRGADVLQTVRGNTGRVLGKLIYETKRTKAWKDEWIPKLKEDQIASGADIAVIVTEVLPKGIERFGFRDGVWVCDFATSLHLARTLRWSLQQVAVVAMANEDSTNKAAVLYDYVTGAEFRKRVESILSHFTDMRDDLESEKRCFQRQWAKREKHLASIQQNVAEMFGAFEGIAGQLESVALLEMAG